MVAAAAATGLLSSESSLFSSGSLKVHAIKFLKRPKVTEDCKDYKGVIWSQYVGTRGGRNARNDNDIDSVDIDENDVVLDRIQLIDIIGNRR
ncbi:unnamed protein product [Orchesella dallaii]|uniref:Uncharacterized protein n=1 Tax=Orchesella dallaii TaxID=48710 RepID=A0ABP1RZJ6_9HEXA